MRGIGTGLPKISLITVLDDLNVPLLAQLLDSVRRQTVDHWSLVILDQRSVPDPSPPSEGRIEWVTSAPDAVANAIAGAELVGLLGRDCWLEPQALAVMAQAAQADADTSIFTCDGDVVDPRGVPLLALVRPEWSPRRLRAQHYCDGLIVIRGAELRGALQHAAADGRFTEIDLLLRLSEAGAAGAHVAHPLFHRVSLNRAILPAAEHSAIVQAHLERIGLHGSARPGRVPGVVEVRLMPQPGTSVSVVIPTRGSSGPSGVLVVEAVRSILLHDYKVDVELVVVHDSDASREYLADLRDLAGSALTIVEVAGPFNFSAKVNAGVAAARGSILVLLNDDIEVLSPFWLHHLVALAAEPDIGAVGAKLLYPDGSVQHAGHCFVASEIRHVMAGRPDGPGPAGEHSIDREVVGVTAACMVVRRQVWDDVGGMDESLPNNFNDVDLCWRLRERGYRIVQANSVQLIHFESRTREPAVARWEAERIRTRLGRQLAHDPYTAPRVALARPMRRSVREWALVSGAVLREEGPRALARKARGRLSITRSPRGDVQPGQQPS